MLAVCSLSLIFCSIKTVAVLLRCQLVSFLNNWLLGCNKHILIAFLFFFSPSLLPHHRRSARTCWTPSASWPALWNWKNWSLRTLFLKRLPPCWREERCGWRTKRETVGSFRYVLYCVDLTCGLVCLWCFCLFEGYMSGEKASRDICSTFRTIASIHNVHFDISVRKWTCLATRCELPSPGPSPGTNCAAPRPTLPATGAFVLSFISYVAFIMCVYFVVVARISSNNSTRIILSIHFHRTLLSCFMYFCHFFLTASKWTRILGTSTTISWPRSSTCPKRTHKSSVAQVKHNLTVSEVLHFFQTTASALQITKPIRSAVWLLFSFSSDAFCIFVFVLTTYSYRHEVPCGSYSGDGPQRRRRGRRGLQLRYSLFL